MSAVVYAHCGRIGDFIGDELMAVFGMEDSATAATDAVAAALAMLATMKQLTPYLKQMYGRRFRVRISIQRRRSSGSHWRAGHAQTSCHRRHRECSSPQ